MSSNEPSNTTVYAAGALLWHEDGGEIKTLVIHREHHGDYSLPKGKVDPGESLPETAAREVLEETGLRVSLGAPLDVVEYTLPSGRPKEVHYWACEVSREQYESYEFVPNDEVDRLEWLTLEDAQRELTYVRDRELIEQFRDRAAGGTHRTIPIVLLRHAKAVPTHTWDGEDDSRPLTARGQAQSSQLVPILEAFAPARIVTSTAVRCRATVAPFAAASHLAPSSERILSQSVAPLDGELRTLLDELLTEGQGLVVCSHSPVMPELVDAIERMTAVTSGTLAKRALLSTAEASVFHVQIGDQDPKLVAVETHGPQI
ncbi:MAG: NUDIX hydrolase [Gulosibacter sp.]|uniref:NUDIX hydrolase n=1 Tax=Gulosibacter sp. TaxID=2817531 RepID=UPI003F90B330